LSTGSSIDSEDVSVVGARQQRTFAAADSRDEDSSIRCADAFPLWRIASRTTIMRLADNTNENAGGMGPALAGF
jgi:hypothetical protein